MGEGVGSYRDASMHVSTSERRDDKAVGGRGRSLQVQVGACGSLRAGPLPCAPQLPHLRLFASLARTSDSENMQSYRPPAVKIAPPSRVRITGFSLLLVMMMMDEQQEGGDAHAAGLLMISLVCRITIHPSILPPSYNDCPIAQRQQLTPKGKYQEGAGRGTANTGVPRYLRFSIPKAAAAKCLVEPSRRKLKKKKKTNCQGWHRATIPSAGLERTGWNDILARKWPSEAVRIHLPRTSLPRKVIKNIIIIQLYPYQVGTLGTVHDILRTFPIKRIKTTFLPRQNLSQTKNSQQTSIPQTSRPAER